MAHMIVDDHTNIVIDTRKLTPILSFTREAIEDKSGGGDHMDAIEIEVVDQQTGKKTRFFVDLFLTRGRVCLHTATNVGTGTNTKRLFGTFR